MPTTARPVTSRPVTSRPVAPHQQALAVGLLVGATVVWGATFVVVKQATDHLGVESFLAWRFLIGGGLLAVARPRALAKLGRRGWAQGLALGLVLAVGYALQTFGLRDVSAAVSGFLTGLQVVFVPLVVWVLLRRRPARPVWAATALAMAGLATISLGSLGAGGAGPGSTGGSGAGELLTLGSALVFALQIVGLGRWSSSEKAWGLATVQLLTVALCSLVATLPSGPAVPAGDGAWAAIAGTAVFATALAFAVQSWAQSQISATRTAIVLALEPVFAAACAWASGERLGWTALAGGALVVAGMLVVETGHLAARRRARYLGRCATHTFDSGANTQTGGRGAPTLGGPLYWRPDDELGSRAPARPRLDARRSPQGGPGGAPREHARSVRQRPRAGGRHGRARLPVDPRRAGHGAPRRDAGAPLG